MSDKVLKSFVLKPLPKIIFGPGRVVELPHYMSSLGNRLLLITGAGSFTKTAHWQQLEQELSKNGIEYFHERIGGEPSPSTVDSICKKYKNENLNVVAAIGGGSAIDGGKAISAMLKTEGSVAEFLEGVGDKLPDGSKVPFVAVPTTAGTGSETTSNAVISKVGKDGFKKSLRHDNYMPDIALVDPELTLGCPRQVAIHCGMDSLSQLVESFLSQHASPYTDDLAYGAIRKISTSLLRVFQERGNLEDRINLSYGASISGITLSNAGLGVVHGFASVIGGLFDIPHGVVCGTLMAKCNEVTLHKLRQEGTASVALHKYAALGRLFSDREKASEHYLQEHFIASLQQFTADCDIARLGSYGITSANLYDIARQSSSKNNPVSLDEEELEAILAARL